jgi:hypothetical protein
MRTLSSPRELISQSDVAKKYLNVGLIVVSRAALDDFIASCIKLAQKR